MTLNYQVTNEEKFSKVVDVEITADTMLPGGGFHGNVCIELVEGGDKIISGEFGFDDYEEEFGFVVTE